MSQRHALIGAATGFVVGAASAFVFNPGYDDSNAVIGVGVLGAAAGGIMGSRGRRLFLRFFLVGTAAGLMVGVITASLVSPLNSDSVLGTGILGAAAGGIIGGCAAAVILTRRWLDQRGGGL